MSKKLGCLLTKTARSSDDKYVSLTGGSVPGITGARSCPSSRVMSSNVSLEYKYVASLASGAGVAVPYTNELKASVDKYVSFSGALSCPRF